MSANLLNPQSSHNNGVDNNSGDSAQVIDETIIGQLPQMDSTHRGTFSCYALPLGVTQICKLRTAAELLLQSIQSLPVEGQPQANSPNARCYQCDDGTMIEEVLDIAFARYERLRFSNGRHGFKLVKRIVPPAPP